MELEKNRKQINQIKYKPISQRAYPITKNEENQKNSAEENNKSFSPNQTQIKNKTIQFTFYLISFCHKFFTIYIKIIHLFTFFTIQKIVIIYN